MKNKIRTLSGVTPVALLTKPYPCPGKCIYCPSQKGIPKSYLKNEPAVMRAVANKFDPINQIWQRLRMYESSGHSIDKIEIIIIGGTFSYYPKAYQKQFISNIYWALNNYHRKLKTQNSKLKTIIQNLKLNNRNLQREKRINEETGCRCIGMSIETRPDYINEEEIKRLRNYGVTRVELGVQTVDEGILKLIKRGHGRKEIITATRLLKNAGFKVCYHLMPNLPGSTPQKDYQVFKEIFDNSNFRPDQLKIYPCVLAGISELKEWYQDGRWKPYSDSEMVDLLSRIKSKIIPRYVRIMRLWRDIPASEIEAGSEMSHMRQVISANLKMQNAKCRCIRCREIMDYPQKEKLILRRTDYQASNGQEIFLEYVDNGDRIYGLLRLRIPKSPAHHASLQGVAGRPTLKFLANGGLIRELHVFGQSLELKEIIGVQHHGLGKQLLVKAEKIVKDEFKLSEMWIISGVGVRNYYQNLGYRLEEEYMFKALK